jgi:hypothetical protein
MVRLCQGSVAGKRLTRLLVRLHQSFCIGKVLPTGTTALDLWSIAVHRDAADLATVCTGNGKDNGVRKRHGASSLL